MKPKLIKVVITDDDQVIMDGKSSPIGLREERMLLQDPRYDVTISKHGLFRVGWQDRSGTPIGPQSPRPVGHDPIKEAVLPVTSSVVKSTMVVNKGPASPVTPNPITPSTPKVDKNPPHSVAPIPNFNA